MITDYKGFTIEILDDPNYTSGSADNVTSYKWDYLENGEYYIPSQCGIRISQDDNEISSAIISGRGGATCLQKNSYLIKNDSIFICCGDRVYCLKIPDLKISWYKELDPATCFGIYEFESDFIVHGELTISRLTEAGEIKWEFGGRDIFVTINSKNAFELKNGAILLRDFEDFEYILDGNGQLIL